MNAIMTRRSTRKFLDKPIEPEKTERILRAAMQSPTGHNRQDWEFLVVTDREKCRAVSEMSQFAVCAAKAPQLIVVLANRSLPDTLVWPCNMGAACQSILIQTEEEGLGAVWLAAYPFAERVLHIKKLFALPEHIEPYAVIAMGYKQYEKPFEDRWDPKKVHWESY